MALVLPQSIQTNATPVVTPTIKTALISPDNPVPTTTDKQGNQMVNFYPAKTYFTNKQAPLAYPLSSLDNLAKAHALAQAKGVAPPGVGEYALSQALVENRPDDFGVNAVQVGYGSAPTSTFTKLVKQIADVDKELKTIWSKKNPTPQDLQRARELDKGYAGLKSKMYEENLWNKPNASHEAVSNVADKLGLNRSTNQEIEPIYKNPKIKTPETITGYKKFDNYADISTGEKGKGNPASYNVLAIANKYYESGQKAKGLDLIQLYNGKGPLAKEYRAKIQDAQYLLSKNPANTQAVKIYNDLFNKYLMQYQREKQHGGT